MPIDVAGDILGAEDTGDLIAIAVIVAAIAFIVYEIISNWNPPNVPDNANPNTGGLSTVSGWLCTLTGFGCNS